MGFPVTREEIDRLLRRSKHRAGYEVAESLGYDPELISAGDLDLLGAEYRRAKDAPTA